ncbi:glutamate--cysteine ligase [Phaeovulum sp.]|uniref:glutamate--cysteine ligase n=1 Tax=Phaeovulum sp. TaxID=2934796 RepID=UPI00272F8809|nr:glutamate--cysteine ligase [Phaeovulum sp.]MDP1669290.1 glutamate--cysteine ligase [Phaeovulum sp.]MDZ4119566.1 glutamate--cysteine ligase [Phaeovulum sp.]
MSIPQEGGGPIERFEELADYIASGEKPREQWRIGTEHEKFGYLTDSLAPLPYEGPRSVRAVLEALQARFGWQPILEQGAIIGLSRNGANVSLEPGGQLELSGAPLASMHAIADEFDTHLRECAEVVAGMGVGFAGIGAAPVWTHAQMPRMPKGRYRLMTDYMDKVGSHGTQMMYRTSTVQVNLDFGSEADMVQKLRVALALQPVATALCASSPFFEGKPNGHKSWRSRIWRDLDASRTGMLPFAFEPGMGYQRYVDWVLDVPMYFVYRDGKYINALGQSFRAFLKGELPALPGELPTLSDWADHMTTVFPEARVKKYLETRGADAGDRAHMLALPALWVGLLYDQNALDAAWDLAKGWSAETREGLRVAASVSGLQAEAGGVKMRDLARQVVAISRAGLAARGRIAGGADESRFLDVLDEDIATGQVQADRLLARYHGEWHGDLSHIYAATRL